MMHFSRTGRVTLCGKDLAFKALNFTDLIDCVECKTCKAKYQAREKRIQEIK